MSSSPLISVTILCYNHEKYISKSIESVLSQTYNNLEIIIVDNASTDNSRKVIEEYMKKENRIKFYSLENNLYPSGGTNYAINKCSGEYIAILSGDDYFEIEKIEIQLEYMTKNNVLNSFTWVNIVNEKGVLLDNHPFIKLFNKSFKKNELEEIFIKYGNTLCALTGMFHKSIFIKYGYFDNRLLQLQDFDFWLRISVHENINILEKKLTNYRILEEGKNLSNQNFTSKARSSFEYLFVMQNVLNFDNQTLSEVVLKDCNNQNKYKNLFEYYIQNNQKAYSSAVLFSMYEKLGNNFNYPSNLYSDFLDCYSSYNLFNESNIESNNFLKVYLDYGEGFSEKNTIKLEAGTSLETYFFEIDLSKYKQLFNIRLDPLDKECIIEVKSCYLILNEKEIDLSFRISSNAYKQKGNKYYFLTDDPQFYFKNINEELSSNYIKLHIEILYIALDKNALRMCIEEKNNYFQICKNSIIKLLKKLGK